MKIVKDSEKSTHQAGEFAVVCEYETDDPALGGATALIRGRYPPQGYVVNTKVKQLVYVLSGSGEIITGDKKHEISAGDIIFIDSNEKFAWNGHLSLFLANTPRFDPAQYRETT